MEQQGTATGRGGDIRTQRTGASGLLPQYLYSAHKLPSFLGSSGSASSSSFASGFPPKSSPKNSVFGISAAAAAASSSGGIGGGFTVENPKKNNFMIPAASEPPFGKIALYSTNYYLLCGFGGLLCCGLTHTAVTPVDVVKCNMQIAPQKYSSISGGFGLVVKEEGVAGLFRGWAPTFFGYCIQGACKYGFYEYFKKQYTDYVGPQNAVKYKTLIYLAGSASAEVIADVGLCPFEAVKVRVQTQPGFAKGLSDGMPKLIASDGYGGLYKGLVPLWGRQIPYTMMKFATFESTVEALYKYAVPIPKEECTNVTQLGISFVAGYLAGIACAIISHPADNLVSFLNNAKGATVAQAVEQMGIPALFTRGLPLRIVMIGTLTGAQWGIYDSFKVFIGLPTTGVVEDVKDAPDATH